MHRVYGRENPSLNAIPEEPSTLEVSKKEDNYKIICCFYSKKQIVVHY